MHVVVAIIKPSPALGYRSGGDTSCCANAFLAFIDVRLSTARPDEKISGAQALIYQPRDSSWAKKDQVTYPPEPEVPYERKRVRVESDKEDEEILANAGYLAE